ncbi:Chitobiase/beta-hexosaminidase domain 2-like protein [Xylariales sp. AK1849]|nr:Chitobiase/beta-hexosaminidase domain 2-like protein [Xylariales sp. AK1849]
MAGCGTQVLPCGIGKSAEVPSKIIALNDTEASPSYTATKKPDVTFSPANVNSAIIVGTVESFNLSGGGVLEVRDLVEDGFYFDTTRPIVYILGQNERGALYGAFEYLSVLAQGNFTKVAYTSNLSAPIRWHSLFVTLASWSLA